MLSINNNIHDVINMMKEHDTLREPAEKIASRKWRNNSVRQKILAERRMPKRGDPSEKESQAEIAKVIKNEERLGSKVKRFENRLKKDIRAMMEGQANLNLQIYLMSLEHRKRVLLKEKLRRLKMAQQEAEKNSPINRDLFGFPLEGEEVSHD